MALLKHRPLCLIISAVVILMLLQSFKPANATLYICCVLAGFMFVFLTSFLKSRKHWRIYLLVLSFAVLVTGLATWRIYTSVIEPKARAEAYIGSEMRVSGRVKEISYQSDYLTTFKLHVEEGDGNKIDADVFCECEYLVDFEVGDRIELKVSFFSVDDLLGDGFYSKISVLAGGYAAYCVSYEDSAVLLERADGIYTDILNINTDISTQFCYLLGDDVGGIASALALGNRAYIGEDVSRDFARSGLAHILALSGSHIMLILGQTDKLLLSAFRLGKRGRSFLLLLLTPLYVVFVLASPPVVRSGIVYMIVCTAGLFGKEYDRITNLFITLLIMALLNPADLFSVSLWMSFLAAISLSAILPPLTDKLSSIRHTLKKRWLFDICRAVLISAIVTVIGVISNILFSWLIFGNLSLVSIASNLIFGPLLTLFLVLSVFLIFLLPFPNIAGAVAPMISDFGRWVMGGISSLASERYAVISLEYDFAGVICILFFLLLVAFLLLEIRRKWTVIIPFSLLVITFAVFFRVNYDMNKGIRVEIMKSSSNESMTVQSDDRYSIIDMSDGRFTRINLAIRSLKYKGACEFESIVITHYHRYHAASLSRVFKREIVRNLLLPVPENEYDTEVMEALERIAGEHGVSVTFYSPSEYTELVGGVYINPMPIKRISRSTHPLLSFRLLMNDKEVVYMGASVCEGEGREMLLSWIRDADAVIFGRHGPIPKKSFVYDIGYISSRDTELYVTDFEVSRKIRGFFRNNDPFAFLPRYAILIYTSK